MEPITMTLVLGKLALLLKGACAVGVAGMAIGAIVFIAELTYTMLTDWFRNRRELANRKTVAASFKNKLKNGESVVVQGFFDKKSGEALDARTIKYDTSDSKVQEIHSGGRVAIFE